MRKSDPLFSFILLVHNMRREAVRTLHTLSRTYQIQGADIDYEVLVVENGSREPLDEAQVRAFGSHVHYHFHETRSPSPVEAMHTGVMASRGSYVVVMNDGARMLSPGILSWFTRAMKLFPETVAAVPGYHLGPGVQSETMLDGYDQAEEDRLLDSVNWREDGYELFRIASLAGSSSRGWFLPLSESNCLAMSRRVYEAIGGVHQGFQSPGGGLIALDFFKCAWEHHEATPVLLLGEGTFHQFHGGVATNSAGEEHRQRVDAMKREYERIRGRPYRAPHRQPAYVGHVPASARPFLTYSAQQLAERGDSGSAATNTNSRSSVSSTEQSRSG